MKDTSSLILNIIVTFVCTLFLQTLVSYSMKGNGEIQYSILAKSKNDHQAVITISNTSKSAISDLKIIVPTGVDTKEIISSNPIKVDTSEHNLTDQDLKLLSVSIIPPSTRTTILIPLHQDSQCCEFANLDRLQLTENNGLYLDPPLLAAFKRGFEIAFIFMLIYIPITIYVFQKLRETSTKLDESHDKIEEASNKIKDLQDSVTIEHRKIRRKSHKEIAKVHLRSAKIKATLVRTISDYSKELNFWKDTIRKMLYDLSVDTKTADRLFESITDTLETYRTQSRIANDAEATLKLVKELNADASSNRGN